MLKILESPLSEVSGQDFTNFSNCMWNMVITLTSCGYGDIYPKSYWGRVVGVIICFWGVLIISFVMVAVTGTFEFSECEDKAYILIMRLAKKELLTK